ncbi:MAG: hypothetical protein HN352_18770, partial [Bacteroidetes bacterium]|nr:hypothetical protein [Bacteroidota bacterium]
MKREKTSALTVFWISIITAFILTLLVRVFDPLLDKVMHLPDAGAKWYYWKLPEPSFWARITAWGGYALHQIAVWWLIIRMMRSDKKQTTISRDNIILLLVNLAFIVFHFIQTHIWYDGLAQDVPIWTSQYSVIIMLVIILLMLFPRRGFLWGKKLKVSKPVVNFLRKYHGLYISWALIYTFWFHPMEGDMAILAGFFYMFLLLIQLSFFNTKIHFNLAWIGLLEFFVAAHGTMIAIMNGQEVWTMFLFGFLIMTVFTHMHGLKLKRWHKFAILAVFAAGMIVAYSFRGWENVYEIIFIPAALYGGAFALWLVTAAGTKIAGKLKRAA